MSRSLTRSRRVDRGIAATVACALALIGTPSIAGASPKTDAEPTTEAPTETATTDAEPPTDVVPEPERAGPAKSEPLSADELNRLKYESARKHYTEGDTLYGTGEYLEAAALYELSYAEVAVSNILFNAGLAYKKGGEQLDAIRALRRYLALADCADPNDALPIDCITRRQEAEQTLDSLMRFVGTLKLSFTDEVLVRKITVAGKPVPLSDFPVYLLPGAVDVELIGAGVNQRREWVAYMQAGETFTISVSPFEEVVVVPPPELPPNRRGEQTDFERRRRITRGLRTAFWAGTGLTAASGVGLAVVGGLTLREQRNHDTEKCAQMCVDDNGDPLNTGYPSDHRANFERYQPIANALVGVTVGLAVTTALIGAFAFRKHNESTAKAKPKVTLGGSGLALRW